MTKACPEIRVVTGPLQTPPPVFSTAAGAVVDFHGVVRGREDAAEIRGLDYEAHAAMATHQLELLADEATARFPLFELIVHHRIGFVPVAEPSLFVRVSAGHRGAAFQAAQWLIDELKVRVPIWKHPEFSQEAGTRPTPLAEALDATRKAETRA